MRWSMQSDGRTPFGSALTPGLRSALQLSVEYRSRLSFAVLEGLLQPGDPGRHLAELLQAPHRFRPKDQGPSLRVVRRFKEPLTPRDDFGILNNVTRLDAADLDAGAYEAQQRLCLVSRDRAHRYRDGSVLRVDVESGNPAGVQTLRQAAVGVDLVLGDQLPPHGRSPDCPEQLPHMVIEHLGQ